MLLNHWMDKYLLAYHNKTPPSYNQYMPRATLWWLYFSPIIYILGALQYKDRL